MIKKIKKMTTYLSMRCYELHLCFKEFHSASRLDKTAYRKYFTNSILVSAHSVEKGLGLKDTVPGHGAKLVKDLINRMLQYVYKGYDTNDFAFRESFSVISKYVAFQKSGEVKSPEFEQIYRNFEVLSHKLGKETVELIQKEYNTGSYLLDREDLLAGKQFDFEAFIKSRHSMRMYEKRPIEKDAMAQVINTANHAPSACNRQASRVYFSNSEKVVSQIDALITGSNGFRGETPNYLIVTTDRVCFAKEEQFQWYINGGIYVSFLVLAMHAEGIGSCIMQWKAFYRTEEQLKTLMGIPKNEAIIAIIGCGYYGDHTRCLEAHRMNADQMMKVVL